MSEGERSSIFRETFFASISEVNGTSIFMQKTDNPFIENTLIGNGVDMGMGK